MRRALNFYKPGDVTTCKVTGVTQHIFLQMGLSRVLVYLAVQDYGAFVAVPSEDGLDHGVRGLIHVSELSWDVVSRPEDVVKIGGRCALIAAVTHFSLF